MNGMRLFFAGVLVMSMHLGAAELDKQPGLIETETTSTDTDIPEAPPLDVGEPSSAWTFQAEQEGTPTPQPEGQLLSLLPLLPQSRFHLPPPPQFLNAENGAMIRECFRKIREQRIPAFKDNDIFEARKCFADRATVMTHKQNLKTDMPCPERDSLIMEADSLIYQLTNIHTKRGGELSDRVSSNSDSDDEDSFNPDDSREVGEGSSQATAHSKSYVTPRFKRTFAWLLGGVAVSTIAAIIYYFKWYKPATVA